MIKVSVVGGTGYTGVELLRLLVSHPEVELVVITSRSEAGMAVADMFPNLRGHLDLPFSEPEPAALGACDLVFFATPNGTGMQMAPTLLEAGARIIDLAADFRLQDPAVWEQWYGMPHACPDVLADAVYGLPEVNREQIRAGDGVGIQECPQGLHLIGLNVDQETVRRPLREALLPSAQQIQADHGEQQERQDA